MPVFAKNTPTDTKQSFHRRRWWDNGIKLSKQFFEFTEVIQLLDRINRAGCVTTNYFLVSLCNGRQTDRFVNVEYKRSIEYYSNRTYYLDIKRNQRIKTLMLDECICHVLKCIKKFKSWANLISFSISPSNKMFSVLSAAWIHVWASRMRNYNYIPFVHI